MHQLLDISKVQDDVVVNGTTSVVVLAAELLRVSVYVTVSINGDGSCSISC